jgi:hypothetical protein
MQKQGMPESITLKQETPKKPNSEEVSQSHSPTSVQIHPQAFHHANHPPSLYISTGISITFIFFDML